MQLIILKDLLVSYKVCDIILWNPDTRALLKSLNMKLKFLMKLKLPFLITRDKHL